MSVSLGKRSLKVMWLALLMSLALIACGDDTPAGSNTGGDDASDASIDLSLEVSDDEVGGDLSDDTQTADTTETVEDTSTEDLGDDTGAVADVGQEDAVDDASEDTGNVGDDAGEDVDDDAPVIVVSTVACEATLASVCATLSGCPNIPSGVQAAITACPVTVALLNDQVSSLCEGYLMARVPEEDVLAVWLNEASEGDVEDCLNNQTCSTEWLTDTGTALGTLAVGGGVTSLETFLTAFVGACP